MGGPTLLHNYVRGGGHITGAPLGVSWVVYACLAPCTIYEKDVLAGTIKTQVRPTSDDDRQKKHKL